MNITKLFSFVFGIIFIIVLYLIIYYSLKIMYKDIKSDGKTKNLGDNRKYGLEILEKGSNDDLEEGSVIVIRDNITIGRKDNNILVLSEAFVSGNHAEVYIKNNAVYIEDLDSTNGVFVNEDRIEDKVKLVANDVIRIGSATFRILRSSNK